MDGSVGDERRLPRLLAVAPEGGGVGDAFGHALASLQAEGRWEIRVIRVAGSTWPARQAGALIARHRVAFSRADVIHVEFGSNDTTLFWLALLLTIRRRPATLVIHDHPKLAHHPAAGLLPSSRRWQSIVGHRVLSPLLDPALKYVLLRLACALAVMSPAALSDWGRKARGTVVVVPHGSVPVSGHRVEPSSGRHILFAGFIGPSKGLDVLLEAWRDLGERSHLPLLIAGDRRPDPNGTVERLRQYSERLKHPPRWLGYVSDESELQDVIATSAIVVLPYRWSNPASGILTRAMLEGRAIVTTRVAATEATIRDGEDAVLVPRDDPGTLAAALEQLLADPERRDRLGASARERARSVFSTSRRNVALERAYEACRSPRRYASRR